MKLDLSACLVQKLVLFAKKDWMLDSTGALALTRKNYFSSFRCTNAEDKKMYALLMLIDPCPPRS